MCYNDYSSQSYEFWDIKDYTTRGKTARLSRLYKKIAVKTQRYYDQGNGLPTSSRRKETYQKETKDAQSRNLMLNLGNLLRAAKVRWLRRHLNKKNKEPRTIPNCKAVHGDWCLRLTTLMRKLPLNIVDRRQTKTYSLQCNHL